MGRGNASLTMHRRRSPTGKQQQQHSRPLARASARRPASQSSTPPDLSRLASPSQQDGPASAGTAPALPRPALDLALPLSVPFAPALRTRTHAATRADHRHTHMHARGAVILPLLPTPEELNTKQQVRVLIEKLIRTVEPKSRLLAFGSTVRPLPSSAAPSSAPARAQPGSSSTLADPFAPVATAPRPMASRYAIAVRPDRLCAHSSSTFAD
jgi:hypothetical protein